MWASLESGFSQATDLAEFVMQTCGVDYRTAYVVVGAAVRRAAAEGLRGIDLTAEMIEEAAQARIGRRLGLAGTDLTEVLDPRAIVGTRRSPGGAAPDVVRTMVADCRAVAGRIRAGAERRLAGYDEAERALVKAAEEVAGR
jgi:argininosuccinate lyase